MTDIIVKDNFLPLDYFLNFKKLVTTTAFDWHLTEVLSTPKLDGPFSFLLDKSISNKNPSDDKLNYECDDIDNYQFTHVFYGNNIPQSGYYQEYITPFIKLLNIKSMLRAKINLNPKTEKNIFHGFHTDNYLDGPFTSILYFNNTDGYTEFKNGKKVQDVENRLVTFPSHHYHSGNTCTNNSYRIVLNLNYF
tara:strand:+ start:78 stop:653 length:576 start_codon:yes stop_codon:yes gene_type:complete